MRFTAAASFPKTLPLMSKVASMVFSVFLASLASPSSGVDVAFELQKLDVSIPASFGLALAPFVAMFRPDWMMSL